jgi:hypothetical protein
MAGSIKESDISWVFPDGPLKEISNQFDVIIVASLVAFCTRYLELVICPRLAADSLLYFVLV